MKLSQSYKEKAFELANVIAKIEEIHDGLRYLDEKEAGNYFPSIALSDVWKPLACALANTIVYWHEYESGDCKDDDKDIIHLTEDSEDPDN